LERQLKHDLGRSPKEWLNEQRMVAASFLLLSRGCVKEVSFELGFKQPSHFCREFKKVYSVTPVQYQAKQAVRSRIDVFR